MTTKELAVEFMKMMDILMDTKGLRKLTLNEVAIVFDQAEELANAVIKESK
ncbi:hypothetical protein [Flavobacterium sp.]|jgi:hypothetical protein|uniref:hypothetical protein n=1 Tax=Flavobacterium sp. TaxID=239 RepID=UPI0037BF4FBE